MDETDKDEPPPNPNPNPKPPPHTHTQVKSTVLIFCRKDSYETYHRLVRTVIADVATRLDETVKDDNPTVHIPRPFSLSSPLHPCFLTLILPNSRPVLSTLRYSERSKG
jgi:hypothetical protein